MSEQKSCRVRGPSRLVKESCGRRDLGAPLVLDAGRPAEAFTRRSTRWGPIGAGSTGAGSHRQHRGQRGAPEERGAELRRVQRRAVHAQGCHRAVRSRDDPGQALGQLQLAGLQQPFDNLGLIRTTCTRTRSRPPSLAGRANRRATTSPPAQLDGEQVTPHLLRTRAGDEEGRRPPLPGTVETGRQRNSPSLQGAHRLKPRSRLAGSPGRAPRPEAGHL